MRTRTSVTILSFCCALTFCFSSCISSRKIDKWVDKKLKNESSVVKKPPEYLNISTSLNTSGQKNSTTQRTTYKMLPLFFYWKWHWAHTCSLNAAIPINNFTNTVVGYGGAKLKRKLDGKQLDLKIEQLPNAFALDDKGYMVFVILAYFGQEWISVQPVRSEMIVSYKVVKDGAATKEGQVIIGDYNKGFHLKMFNSTKRKTWEYIDTYNENITRMSKAMVDQLLTELD